MVRYSRRNDQMASNVAAGLNPDMMRGNVNAWTYLRRHVPPEVALRILSQSGARRGAEKAPPFRSLKRLDFCSSPPRLVP